MYQGGVLSTDVLKVSCNSCKFAVCTSDVQIRDESAQGRTAERDYRCLAEQLAEREHRSVSSRVQHSHADDLLVALTRMSNQ